MPRAAAPPTNRLQGSVRNWAALPDSPCVLFNIKGNRWCGNVDGPHKSNGIFFVVDTAAGAWYQKCYDPQCRSYRSEVMPLPLDVWQSCRPPEEPEDDAGETLGAGGGAGQGVSGDDDDDELLLMAVQQVEDDKARAAPAAAAHVAAGGMHEDVQAAGAHVGDDDDDEVLFQAALAVEAQQGRGAATHASVRVALPAAQPDTDACAYSYADYDIDDEVLLRAAQAVEQGRMQW
jgi:hypothetical protein